MALTVGMYSFDCSDAATLAGFWSGVLDRPVDDGATAAYATIGVAGTPSFEAWSVSSLTQSP